MNPTTEPVRLSHAVPLIVAAIVAVAGRVGLNLTPDETATLTGIVATVAAAAAARWARARVTPTKEA